MKKEWYLKQRAAIMAEAQALIDGGKPQEATAKMEEVKKLDEQYEAAATAAANMAALQKSGASAMNIAGMAVEGAAGDAPAFAALDNAAANSANIEEAKAKREAELYNAAFGKYLAGSSMTADEKTTFEAVNQKYRMQNAAITTVDNAILVPETVRNMIWAEIADQHPLFADVVPTFVPGDITVIKDETGEEDAEWIDEDQEAPDSAWTPGSLTLSGCEVAKAITLSWKLKKMSIEAFVPYVVGKLSKKVGAAITKAIAEGKGKPGDTDTFKAQAAGICPAIRNEVGTPQRILYSDADKLTYTKFTEAMAAIKSGYLRGASIYANNKTIWGRMANILDTNKRPLFIPDVTAGGVGRMFGLPVKEEAAINADAILIFNPSEGYAININENVTLYTEDHVKPRATDYMAYAIVDGGPLTTKAAALIEMETPEPEPEP